MELEVVHGGQSEDRSNRLELCDWGERLVVVDTCLLGETSSDQSSLVPVDRAIRKPFDLEHPLAGDNSTSSARSRHKVKDLGLLERAHLVLCSRLPLFGIDRVHGLVPRAWLMVRAGLSRQRCKGMRRERAWPLRKSGIRGRVVGVARSSKEVMKLCLILV